MVYMELLAIMEGCTVLPGARNGQSSGEHSLAGQQFSRQARIGFAIGRSAGLNRAQK